MREFIIRQNVERFRRMLANETDPAKRDVLAQLLATEEAKRGAADQSSADGAPATSGLDGGENQDSGAEGLAPRGR